MIDYLRDLNLKPEKNFLRETLQLTIQSLMEMDVSAAVDAGYYERSGQRLAYRNGYRERQWRSSVGEITLRVPKLRKGTYYPDFLFSAEAPILDFLTMAYLQNVEVADVESLLKRLDFPTIPRNQLVEFCDQLNAQNRPLEDVYPCLWLEAVNDEYWLAIGLRNNGARELLGLAMDSHTLLENLKARGVRRVQVVTGEDHEMVQADTYAVYPKADWQHYERDLPYHRLVSAYPAITIAIARILTLTRRFAAAQMLCRTIFSTKMSLAA